ncbi:MAG: DNA mismatch repair endonuclease MutL, partial [Deltaproteobacteria bacterium]|nr:DNA mismatch repair endonuclease MutL [Deltaproteobacteria bacterium]
MSPRIQVLSPDIANRIAAGEVVERPASIVKELIENAIDAEAEEIRIEVEGGGLVSIRITDDGTGMAPEDATRCIERHATSKIRTAEDLAAIRTLGFRGEALPSIAAVARVAITTKARDSVGAGIRLRIEGGAVAAEETVGCASGTEIHVTDLFFNTPARKKFLKGERTEFGHLHETVIRFALAYPHIRFRLRHNGRSVLAAHDVAEPRHRLAELFGAGILEQILPIAVSEGPVRLQGFVGCPAFAQTSAQKVFCFVNGRPVRDRVVLHAIHEGYRTYLPGGAHPFVVLHLAMHPDIVDVNVHPAKAEVRFANPGAVHRLIATAIRKCLAVPTGLAGSSTYPRLQSPTFGMALVHDSAPQKESDSFGWSYPQAWGMDHTFRHSRAAVFRPLGQLAGTYLLYEGPEGCLVLIDQHAAHERIGFERLRAQYRAAGIAKQTLLLPVIVDLGPTQVAAIAEHQAILAAIGIDAEPFGGGSVAVTALPVLLAGSDVPTLVKTLASELVEYGRTTAMDAATLHLLATMACHRQVRAGDPLSEEELTALV